MTLKTVTGPTIRDALADARRLFGPDVVLLQSAPEAHGQPASVTVAFDPAPVARTAPAPARPTSAPARSVAPPAIPEPVSAPAPRAYGYAAARNARPAPAEPISATRPAPIPPRPSLAPAPAEPVATAAEVAELRARLAELEAALARVRPSPAMPAPTRRSPLVFVGPAGAGKTSLALRLALRPELADAARPAVLKGASETAHAVDAAAVFWEAGVPVAVVRTPEDVVEALDLFVDADLLLVDTPALPLQAERAHAAVARLGALLAPLEAVEVHLVVDATRAPESLTADTVVALGLCPDALALTRVDEAPALAARWARHLGLDARFASLGPDPADVTTEALRPVNDAPAPPSDPSPDLRALVTDALAARRSSALTHV